MKSKQEYKCKVCGTPILFIDTFEIIHDGMCSRCYLNRNKESDVKKDIND